MKLRQGLLGFALLALLLCLSVSWVAASGPLAVLGIPTDDVYIDDAAPDINFNYGSPEAPDGTLYTGSSNGSCVKQVIYLKFNVGTGAALSNWMLTLQAIETNSSSVLGLYAVADTWSEGSLTYTSAVSNSLLPAGSVLASVAMTGNAGLVAWQGSGLDNYINNERGPDGDGIVSLAVRHTTCNAELLPWRNRFCDKENVALQTAGCTEAPLPVTLAAFKAVTNGRTVNLEWTTGSEVDSVGFNVWRSEVEDGEYVKLTETLIPGQGDSTTGASYSFLDANVALGKTYFYKLEDLNSSGRGTFHNPVSVTVRTPGKRR